MNKFAMKLARFMYGRYGFDESYYLLTTLWFLFFILGIIFRGWLSVTFNILSVLALAFSLFRVMSKNTERRRKENAWIRKLKSKCKAASDLNKSKKRDKDTHIYVKCNNCHAILRLPKIPGEHGVTCPKCKNKFSLKVK